MHTNRTYLIVFNAAEHKIYFLHLYDVVYGQFYVVYMYMQYLVLHTIFNMLEGVLCLKQLENCDVCGWMNVELCEYTYTPTGYFNIFKKCWPNNNKRDTDILQVVNSLCKTLMLNSCSSALQKQAVYLMNFMLYIFWGKNFR